MSNLTAEQELLSSLTVFSKYARYWTELGRRETYEEIVARNRKMHLDHVEQLASVKPENLPKIKELIDWAYERVHRREVFPSMRSMQFGDEAILKNNVRIYNCAHRFADEVSFFQDLMYLLLCGTGVGFNVQKHLVEKLPPRVKIEDTYTFTIPDSIEGWAEAVGVLYGGYLITGRAPTFDYSLIRPRGSLLKTSGGKAPGPEPLRRTLDDLRKMLDSIEPGEKLRPIQVHDMACTIARAVLSGGIRRSAMISLFSPDDEEMLNAKVGKWWEINPDRAYANNSAVLLRGRDDEMFHEIFATVRNSGSGEPGIYWVDDLKYGSNPCKPLQSTILTDEGYITFAQALEKDSLRVVLADGSVVNASKPFKTGENRTVMRFTLSNGLHLYGTPDHLHLTRDGQWKRMDEVEIGDHLAFSSTQVHDTEVGNRDRFDKGMLAGWLHADGSVFERQDSPGLTASLCFGVNEFDVAEMFERVFNRPSKPHHQKPDTCRVMRLLSEQIPTEEGMTLDKGDLTWLYGKDKDFKLGFIKAAFTADGSVRKNNNVELYSIRRGALEVMSNILREFGIYSTVGIHNYAKSYIASDGKVRNNSDTWKLNVYSGQFRRIGFLSEFKNNLLASQVEKPIYRYSDYVAVVDIEPEYSVEDVYDITVDHPDHAFLDNGVVTHNCGEITLNNKQKCNLTTMNAGTVRTQQDFNERAKAAAIIGTLQASYTNFPFLSDGWEKQTRDEALLGVSMTGIASGFIENLDEAEAMGEAVKTNKEVAALLGINPAARVGTLKPEGSASLVAGTSSGIHAWHDKFYLRRTRYNKVEPLAQYLIEKFGISEGGIVEQDVFNPDQIVVAIPQKAPEGAATRDEGAMAMLERVLRYNRNWIRPGNVYGGMPNNVSATVNVRDDEWDAVHEWMWNNRYEYNGLSLLPYADHTYVQAPFESIDEATFERMATIVREAGIDLSEVREFDDNTDLAMEAACAGGACEWTP